MIPEIKIITDEGIRRREYLSGHTVDRIIDRKLSTIAPYILNPNVLIVVNLEGARWFVNKLVYEVSKKYGVDHSDLARYIKVKSATGQAQHGEPHIEQWFTHPEEVEGKDVLVPEDINDNGHTLKKVQEKLLELKPKSIMTAVLFEKDDVPKVFTPDIIFAHVPNKYWIGSGLDDGTGYGRELPGLWEVILHD